MKKSKTRRATGGLGAHSIGRISRTYGYVRSLQLEGRYPRDVGVHTITAKRILMGWGCVPERLWPYPDGALSWPPTEPPGMDMAAKKGRIGYYMRVRSVDEAKLAISRKWPVSASIPVTANWFDAPEGIVEVPRSATEIVGDHAVTLYGYSDATNRFHFINSWGAAWGNQGCGQLPYQYFARHILDSFVMDPRHRPMPSMSEPAAMFEWGVRAPTGFMVHVKELRDTKSDEKMGWSIAVERDGHLDVEDLFVKPAFRAGGNARRLVSLLERVAVDRELPLRYWVPHGDCSSEKDRARLGALVGLPVAATGRSWASAVAAPRLAAVYR